MLHISPSHTSMISAKLVGGIFGRYSKGKKKHKKMMKEGETSMNRSQPEHRIRYLDRGGHLLSLREPVISS